MKIIELTNNLLMQITNEEAELLEQFDGDTRIAKSTLSERDQLLANNLTVKDVLHRSKDDGKIYYQRHSGAV